LTQIAEYVPERIEIKRLKAVVRISLRVVDVKTGEILFLCTEMQQAEGESDINLEGGLLGGLKIRGGVTSFQNTVTGKATELALNNLTDYVIDFFNGKISEKTFTGNIIEISDLNKSIRASQTQKQIIDIIEKEYILIAEINSGTSDGVKVKDRFKVYSPKLDSSYFRDEKLTGKFTDIGIIKVQQTGAEKSNGQLSLNKLYDKKDILANNYVLKYDPLYSRIKVDAIACETERVRLYYGLFYLPGQKAERSFFFIEPNFGISYSNSQYTETPVRIHTAINAGILVLKNLARNNWLAIGIHLSAFNKEIVTHEDGISHKFPVDGPGFILEGNYKFLTVFGAIGFGVTEIEWNNGYTEDENFVLGSMGVGFTF